MKEYIDGKKTSNKELTEECERGKKTRDIKYEKRQLKIPNKIK